MNTTAKHFKIINSRTGNVIHYCSFATELSADELKAELNKVKAQVATTNRLNQDTIYWEEVKVEE